MMFSDDVEGWDEGTGWGLKEGGGMCIIMTYLHFCMAETNRTL